MAKITIQKINQMAEKLKELRKKYDEQKLIIDAIKLEKDGIQQELLEALKSNNLKQWKTETETISRQIRNSLKIVNPFALRAWMKGKNLEPVFLVEEVNKEALEKFAKENKEEKIEGVEMVETEFVSIRNIKE